MVAGRSAPRHQSIAVLYPRSTHLQSYLSEYYIVVVSLCHKLLRFTQKSTVCQLVGALSSPDINTYRAELDQWATEISEEMSILMAEKLEREAQENWRFRALAAKVSASTLQWQRLNMNRLILENLSKHDFEKTWKQTRKVGNTTLLNRNVTYQEWKDRSDSCTLVYAGKLGCGKSVLLANMVDDINLHVQDKNTLVAYFFTRHDIPESLEARTIVGSLAYQFLRMIPDLDLTGTAVSVDNRRSTLDVAKIYDLLRQTLPTEFKAYIVLDGIDDCDDAERGELIQHLHVLQATFKVLLCISHRLESNSSLKHYLRKFVPTFTSIPENNPDIEEFIEAELESCIQSRKLVLNDPCLILEIQDALQEGSKGMFLWTALQIVSLCFMKTDGTIRQALRDLPKDLAETYSRILNRSRELGAPYQKRILELVTAAQRPLTAEELGEAISVVPGDTTWDPAKTLNDVSSVLACCGSLLINDEEDFTIRFVHHSVKTFLLEGHKESEAAFTIQGAKRTIAETIITYLNYGVFGTQLSTTHSQVMCQSLMPGIVHSVLRSSSTVSNLALRFLRSRRRPDFDMNKVVRETAEERSGTSSTHQHPFRAYARLYGVQHILDLSDFDMVMDRLLLRLFRGVEVDATVTDELGKTPLSLAAEIGNESVVRAILESRKAEVNSKDIFGRTPLVYAVMKRHDTVVKLLLETGKADTEVPISRDRQTQLSFALEHRYEELVKLLVEIGKANTNQMDNLHQTPLSRAAQKGEITMVKLLLAAGDVDINSRDIHGETPLWWAAKNGHETVVKLLVEIGKADVNTKNNDGDSPLTWAARNGESYMAKLLLETGRVNLELKGLRGKPALVHAAEYNHQTVLKLLLETATVDVNTRDKDGNLPLTCAAKNGHKDVVARLLDTGKVDVQATDGYNQTALSLAKQFGRDDIAWLLESYRPK